MPQLRVQPRIAAIHQVKTRKDHIFYGASRFALELDSCMAEVLKEVLVGHLQLVERLESTHTHASWHDQSVKMGYRSQPSRGMVVNNGYCHARRRVLFKC